jgi:hypothetical protein
MFSLATYMHNCPHNCGQPTVLTTKPPGTLPRSVLIIDLICNAVEISERIKDMGQCFQHKNMQVCTSR